MSSIQILARERHGSHSRLSCYFTGASHTWDAEWDRYSPAAVRRVMEYYRRVTPIYRTLLRYLPRDGEVLEAGSGLGFWVALLNEAGCRARGIDYSEEALSRARRTFPGLRFDHADVRSLPFADGSLAGYVSFGVAEHFVEGPDAVLREAARVLRPAGILILTVPWISPLRRLQPGIRSEAPREGHFYQYFFEKAEMRERTAACGFRILATTSYGASKTLFDLLREMKGGRAAAASKAQPAAPSTRTRTGAEAADESSSSPTLARKLFWHAQDLVLENPVARRLAGHMLMLVAVRADREIAVQG